MWECEDMWRCMDRCALPSWRDKRAALQSVITCSRLWLWTRALSSWLKEAHSSSHMLYNSRQTGRCRQKFAVPAVSVSACLWVCRVRVVLLAPTGELSLKWHTFIHSTWGQRTGELGRTLPWCCSVYYERLFSSFWDQFDVGAKWQHNLF